MGGITAVRKAQDNVGNALGRATAGKKPPKVPDPSPPPKREQAVSKAFSKARGGRRLTRGLGNTDLTGGLLGRAATAKKTLLGE